MSKIRVDRPMASFLLIASPPVSRFSTRRIFPSAAERLLFLKQCTPTEKDFQFPLEKKTPKRT